MIYELPANPTDITHIKVDQFNYYGDQIRIHVLLGTTVDGSFEAHPISKDKGSSRIAITDMEAFNAFTAAEETAPETVGDIRGRLILNALKFIDSNNMWEQLNL